MNICKERFCGYDDQKYDPDTVYHICKHWKEDHCEIVRKNIELIREK